MYAQHNSQIQRQWRLLSEAEIRSLSPQDLQSYTAWLKVYRQQQDERIAQKQAHLNKIRQLRQQQEEGSVRSHEQEDIASIRQRLTI